MTFRTLASAIRGLVACFLASTSITTTAGLIDHGSYITDTASGLDWLDVTATQGLSYEQIQASALITLGWRFASRGELTTLLANFGLPPVIPNSLNSYADPTVRTAVRQVADLLGNTFTPSSYGGYWYGLVGFYDLPEYDPMAGFDRVSAFFIYDEARDYNQAFIASNNTVFALSVSDPIYGGFLVRAATAVPEPSTLLLVASALLVSVILIYLRWDTARQTVRGATLIRSSSIAKSNLPINLSRCSRLRPLARPELRKRSGLSFLRKRNGKRAVLPPAFED